MHAFLAPTRSVLCLTIPSWGGDVYFYGYAVVLIRAMVIDACCLRLIELSSSSRSFRMTDSLS